MTTSKKILFTLVAILMGIGTAEAYDLEQDGFLYNLNADIKFYGDLIKLLL